MKILLLSISLFLSVITLYGQDRFEFSSTGLFPDYIVVELDTLSPSELYEICIRWIKETYTSPDEVIQMKIENEQIRFQGFKKSATHMNAITTSTSLDAKYTIEISFKDGKFKFDPVDLSLYHQGSKITWIGINFAKPIFKGNGEVRGMYRPIPEDIANMFTSLMRDFAKYTITQKQDDW